jgi:HAE1 family hydrophobic/amphiphilic exporter-1
MYIEGETLNTLSLFSMILVLGLIVDPAIVVVEAIQHELDLGKRGMPAIMAAVNTIGAGVFMAALTSVIAFIPFGVVSGIFGAMIRHIPATIIPALVASYFVPLLFLTYLSSRWLRSSQTRPLDEDDPSTLWGVSRWFIRANHFILDRTWLQVTIIALAVVLPIGVSGVLFATKRVVPVQFSAPKDSDLLSLTLEYPANLSDISRAKLVQSVEAQVSDQDEVKYMYPMQQQAGSITWYLTLQPRSQRSLDSSEYVGQLQQEFTSTTDAVNRIFVTLAQVSNGPPSSDFPVSVNIYDDNLDTLKQTAIETGNFLRQDKRVTRVDDGFTDTKNEKLDIVLDQAKVASIGLSGVQVGQILAGVVGESEVTQFDMAIDGHLRPIKVLLTKGSPPESIRDVEDVVLFALPSGPIRVKDVATVTKSDAFIGIDRLNGKRFVTVQAKTLDAMKDGPAVQESVTKFWTTEKLKAANLSSSALEDRGSGNEFIKSFKDLFIACGIAILMTFVVLVLFFRSFMQPLIILFAIPLGFLGIFPALSLEGGQFGFLEILGLITLIGIVENVGIFLIDLANQRVAKGMSPKDAIALASGIRFRPVFLTKITALGGLLPLMLLSPFWRSLTLVVVTGIITSGVLSLFTTPILYVWFQKRQRR